jgi:hypothetical protein
VRFETAKPSGTTSAKRGSANGFAAALAGSAPTGSASAAAAPATVVRREGIAGASRGAAVAGLKAAVCVATHASAARRSGRCDMIANWTSGDHRVAARENATTRGGGAGWRQKPFANACAGGPSNAP